jgi:hypothetical protein
MRRWRRRRRNRRRRRRVFDTCAGGGAQVEFGQNRRGQRIGSNAHFNNVIFLQ